MRLLDSKRTARCSPESIDFVEQRQKYGKDNSDSLWMLICIHGCCHCSSTGQLFSDSVLMPRHQYRGNEPNQKSAKPEKGISPKSLWTTFRC
jgi:hypothetical protein